MGANIGGHMTAGESRLTIAVLHRVNIKTNIGKAAAARRRVFLFISMLPNRRSGFASDVMTKLNDANQAGVLRHLPAKRGGISSTRRALAAYAHVASACDNA